MIDRGRTPKVIETMTLNQVVDAMRGLGMRTTETRVRLLLEAGTYPFGACVPTEKGHIVEVYAKKFWEWVDERAEEDI